MTDAHGQTRTTKSGTLKIERRAAAAAGTQPDVGKGREVALLTLSNPDKRNALDPTMFAALGAALAELAQGPDAVSAAVVTSSGPLFSAGYDVSALPDEPDEEWLRGHGGFTATMKLLCEGPLPTVAALPGAAIGAGCELALSCDLRVAHPGVTLCMPPVRLGLIYTPEGMARLMALCGAARARRLLLLGESLPAELAATWGLIDEVVPESEVLERAIALARTLGAMPRPAVLGTRIVLERLMQEGPQLSEASAQEILRLRRAAWRSPEAQSVRQRFRK